MNNQDLKLYIVVNKDIIMSKAKLGIQIGHACTEFTLHKHSTDLFRLWKNKNNQTKVILKAPEKELVKLESEDNPNYITIRDAGKTELEPNTLTCVCLGIGTKAQFSKEINNFKRWRLC